MKLDDKTRNHIVALAEGLLSDSVDYLTTVIELARCGVCLFPDEWENDFKIFRIIDSDSDHLPLPHTRELCAQSWLDKCDKELEEIKVFYKADVEQACGNLINLYKKQ